MTLPKLQKTDWDLVVYRFSQNAEIPKECLHSQFLSVTRTPEELSVVCFESISLQASKSESGWGCLKVIGPLDFSLTGILSAIAKPLSDNNIPVFVISTFDTDYILIKRDQWLAAGEVLELNGFTIV